MPRRATFACHEVSQTAAPPEEREASSPRAMHRGSASALGWTSLTATAVVAECTALDPWPSFQKAVPTAKRVIVGEVVEDRDPNSSGYLSLFGLRVDEVLRGKGEVGKVIEIRYLSSGLPGTICPRNTNLRVLPGDVIAIAFDALAPDRRSHINAVAWVRGTPDTMQRGVGSITMAELRDLAALPPTDAAELLPLPPPRAPLLALFAGFVTAVVAATRRAPTASSRRFRSG